VTSPLADPDDRRFRTVILDFYGTLGHATHWLGIDAVLAELRARGLQLAVCSNWDWDLAEAIDEVGLTGATDVVVSSAWAGARKPHPRIYEHTLAATGADPEHTLFVGDTWGPDVIGPRTLGMTPLYLLRVDHWADPTAPDEPAAEAMCANDLTALLTLTDLTLTEPTSTEPS